MSYQSRPRIGISIGDLNGIGSEVVLKCLDQFSNFDFVPLIFASSTLVSALQEKFGTTLKLSQWHNQTTIDQHTVYVVNVWTETPAISYGTLDHSIGQYAFQSLEAATKALRKEEIDVLLTAPINKASIKSTDFPFPGHTDYLNQHLDGKSLMLMVSGSLRIGLLTDHLPLNEVSLAITVKLISEKVRAMHWSLRFDFDIESPKIALLGLDPHAGDSGAIGQIDQDLIRPCLDSLRKKGIDAEGPFAADGFFGSGMFKNYDGILACYHDQGLIPFKLLSFGKGVNFTAGLNRVRVSPDHGTAFDIAGQNKASISSFKEALKAGITIHTNRLKQKGK
jgi:4-phospho-D-threonate 3-dehydrogenase / 4-phospho-D-erythronate 3-dehydrogenase